MSGMVGTFVWCELLTTDPQAAITFYTDVIGWRAEAMTSLGYTVLSAGGAPVAGLMALPEPVREFGGGPFWSGYIGVADVDEAMARVVAAGGAVHRAASDIAGVGRFAVVGDPQGAVFTLFTPAPPAPAHATEPLAPGHIGWHELHAADGETAFGFYAAEFGWTPAGSLDMGPMGLYRMFAYGDAPAGGILTKSDKFPRPSWIFYFNVDTIEAAIGRVTAAGGSLLNGPHQVPTGQWIAHCLDPQGAFFAMLAPDHTA